jgi:glucose/arabinose dehydrogenase
MQKKLFILTAIAIRKEWPNILTGAIWEHEHGPQGGDEINIVKKGANYGWPVATYGIDYDNTIISNIQQKKVQDPEYYWAPPSLQVEWHL